MDKFDQDVCKSHSCRAEKDSFRICPSKLSKRELEELYFTLLENNMDLKKTNNIQREKLRLLSTKLLRVNSAQKRHLCSTQSKCCTNAHQVIEEQKSIIQDLQLLNSRMVEKIRQLNMKLCSQKQFRCSPSRASSKYRCLSADVSSRKNVITQDSGTNLACSIGTARSQNNEGRNVADQDAISHKLDIEKMCHENKCQSQICELKHKIVALQEELNRAHSEYMERIKALEEEVHQVQEDKSVAIRATQAAGRQDLTDQEEQRKKLMTQLRDTESTTSSLAAELSIERKRVIELRAQVKAAALANEVIKMLEDHLMKVPSKSETDIGCNEAKEAVVPKTTKSCMNVVKSITDTAEKEEEQQVANEKVLVSKSLNVTDRAAGKSKIFDVDPKKSDPQSSKFLFQHRSGSDTSYFTRHSLSELETNLLASSNEETGLVEIIRQLMKKIAKLQSELDALKISHANTTMTPRVPSPHEQTPIANTEAVSQADIRVVNSITDDKCVIVDPTQRQVEVDKAYPSTGETDEKISDDGCSPDGNSHVEIPCSDVTMPCVTTSAQTKRAKQQSTGDNCCGIQSQAAIKSRTLPKESNNTKRTPALSEKKAKAMPEDTPDVSPALQEIEGARSMALGICEQYVKVCTCKKLLKPRESWIFRSCCGTSKFKTTSLYRNKFRNCVCKGSCHENNLPMRQSQSFTDIPVQGTVPPENSESSMLRKTFTVKGEAEVEECPKSISSNNTEQDITSITYKTDKDGDSLSYGEERQICYTMDNCTSTEQTTTSEPVVTDNLFSDGEIPPMSRRRISYDLRAMVDTKTSSTLQDAASDAPSKVESTTFKVEEALRAITAELSKCRELLQTQKHTQELPTRLVEETPTRDVAPMILQPEPTEDVKTVTSTDYVLRKTPANPRIPDKPIAECNFVIHIGSVVLSDEAVVSTKNLNLFLQWKFYDQNYTITPMRTGRVVHFDFSTEYVVKVTDDFLQFLKEAQMVLVICEMGSESEPVAHCLLPLREVLLQPNRRVDISLTLLAGLPTEAGQPCDEEDELGVLDLWCLLRYDAPSAPLFDVLLAQTDNPVKPDEATLSTTKPGKANTLPIMEKIAEETSELSDLETYSNYIDYRQLRRSGTTQEPLSPPPNVPEENASPADSSAERLRDVSVVMSPASVSLSTHAMGSPFIVPEQPILPMPTEPAKFKRFSLLHEESLGSALKPSPRESSKHRAYSSLDKQKSSKDSLKSRHADNDTEAGSSEIIVYQIPTNVKTANEMKQVLEMKTRNSSPTQSEIHKTSNISVSAHTMSISSMKSTAARKLFQNEMRRLSLTPEKKDASVVDMLQNQHWNRLSAVGPGMPGLGAALPGTQAQGPPPPPPPSSACARTNKAPRVESDKRIASETLAQLDVDQLLSLQKKEQRSCYSYGGSKSSDVTKKSVKIDQQFLSMGGEKEKEAIVCEPRMESVDITVVWLALNEECEAMLNPRVTQLYVAYAFLGRAGAELETPLSMPKPRHYVEKVYFDFKKTFRLEEAEWRALSHMARCTSSHGRPPDPNDCIVFTVVSEPAEDPLGLDNCEDIGHAYLYLGDLLTYCSGDSYTEVVPVRAAGTVGGVCGVLAVRVDGLDVVRRCAAQDGFTAHKVLDHFR